MILWWTYQQLRAGNPKTRLAAVAKLAETAGADAFEPLVFALKDKEAEVRSAAILALTPFKDPRVTELLLQQLRDPAPLVRGTAVDALGRLNEQRAVDWLVKMLLDADVGVRKKVLDNLQRLGWEAQTDAHRAAIIVAKGNVREVAELGSDGIAPLVKMMREAAPEKQIAAIRALGETGDPAIVKPLLEALRKNDPLMRIAALEVLEDCADPSAYPAIERCLRDGEAGVRVAAVQTAVRCGGAKPVPLLLKLMKDPSWEVRQKTAKALGSLKDAAAVEGLGQLLRDRDRDVRESAANALGQIRDAAAIKPLILAMMDFETIVRKAAAYALARINPRWADTEAARSMIPQIKTAVAHREYWVSQSAGKLLDQIIAASKKTEEDTDAPFAPPKPKPAMETISAPSAEAAVPERKPHAAFAILSDLLRDADRDLRLAAAETFGRLRETSAKPLLQAAAQDGDVFVRAAAEQALGALN